MHLYHTLLYHRLNITTAPWSCGVQLCNNNNHGMATKLMTSFLIELK